MTPPELLTEWSRLLLGSLRAAGLRDVVISPGSRSTPFAWAALQEPGLTCHSIVDERSAAFFALGHARMTGDPVLLVCTSGTAVANYFPAVVEAAESATPLLVLSADRPFELQAAAAPQTIDQTRLYGHAVRGFFELGAPDADPRMLRAVPRIAAQAIFTTRHPAPGPVHINARARKPLEPVDADPDSDLRRTVDRLLAGVEPTTPPRSEPAPDALRRLGAAIARAERGLIVCGPALRRDAADAAALAALAERTGFPVAAEAASQLRFRGTPRPPAEVDALTALLEVDGFAARHLPDLVIGIGRPPTASAWHTAVETWGDTERWVLTPRQWPDPWSGARIIHGPVGATLRGLQLLADGNENGLGDPDRPERTAWRDRLTRANAAAWRVIDDRLDDGFSEGAAVRAVIDGLPTGSVLALGNSLPIREADLFAPAADRGLHVAAQRGANGIDGLISGAAGAAAATGRPTGLLLGDVSFLHDIGGLAAARHLPAPLVVVVLNNGGGRIFERLPLRERVAGDPAFETWLTPPELDLQAAARAFGVGYARAADRVALRSALDAALDRPADDSTTVVEVVVPAGGTTRHQQELRDRLAAEVGE